MKSDEAMVEGVGRGGPVIARRTVLQAGAALGAAAAFLEIAEGATPAHAATTYDLRQRFVQLVGGGSGVIYAVQADGRLLWYRHQGWLTSTSSWTNNGTPRQIGSGWAGFATVLAGADGTIFAVRGNGDLLWYRYVLTNWSTGAGYWAANSGARIGTGFNRFARMFGGYDNVIWGIQGDGGLYRYQYLRKDGTSGSGAWAGGNLVGTSWQVTADVAADVGGVIYTLNGSLRWYRYVNGAWASGSGRTIGSGWSDTSQRTMLCTGAGSIYRLVLDTTAVPNLDDKLFAYRLTNYTTVGTDGAKWYYDKGRQVGSGFTVGPTANLQGYETTLTARAGGSASFAVSTTFPSYQASVLRLAPGTSPTLVRDPVPVTGALHILASDYRSAGCRWPNAFSVDIPTDWPSGLYAARLEGPGGLQRHIPFTVRPAQPTASVAVLLSTFNYLAYNHWSGHNQYTLGEAGRQRTMSLFTPQHRFPIAATGRRDHTWWSDQLLMRWMSREGIAYDVYDETDLHDSVDWLTSYQTLVLPTHPEYWTETMRTNLIGWLGTGGRLIYTGGNGIYERIVYDPATRSVRFRRSDGLRDYYRAIGLPETQILGVGFDSRTFGSFAAYQVTRDHPLYEGTGLRVGDVFGQNGYNGAASGWEVDARLGLGGDATPDQVIAEGLHTYRSSMVFMERENGGFVFSAGSLTFNGGLDRDSRMSALLRNVFNRALAPNPQQLASPPADAKPERTTPVPERGREGATE
jgi:N,N-dimethylformamidase